MARRSFAKPVDSAGDEINVTPLMDIVFIMLIFFIVTSTFVKEPGADINKPEAATGTVRRLASILVAVTAENEVWINKKKVDVDQVRGIVEGLRRENPKGTAVVQVDKAAEARFLVDVINQIRDAGIDDVAISTIQQSSA
jgi:biopolymer transport protein ExbD